MINWSTAAAELTRLARLAKPEQLLSITLPLSRWPTIAAPPGSDWCYWQRPDRNLRFFGLSRTCTVTSAGAGRFAALRATQRGLEQSWIHCGELPPLAITGFAFASQGGSPLPNASLWVPQLLLREANAQVWLTLSCTAGNAKEAPAQGRQRWQSALQAGSAVPPAPTFAPCPSPLADEAFLARGRAALRAITTGMADKLVLTRSLRLKSTGRLSPYHLLTILAAQHPTCATFGVGQDEVAFVGTSPETLLTLAGCEVTVDALAGTAWQTSALDLGADKNRREHDFVAHAVARSLAELCQDIHVPDNPEVMLLNTLTHLRRRVTARRPADVAAFDLISRIHPTPAIGGVPGHTALDWLARHADRRDAWYTGGIGWIDAAGDCDIAVALRCGLFEGSEAKLYAGAGFVAGSDPEQELAETEAKLSTMRDGLSACACLERDIA